MKKTLLLSTMILGMLAGLVAQDTTITEVWTKFGGSAPDWFTDGTEATEHGENSISGVERGIAYNAVDGNLYVSSRHHVGENYWCEPHVYVLDPMTGETPAFSRVELSTDGIRSDSPDGFGGGYALNNVHCSEDGYILASNMTLASGPDIPSPTGGNPTIKAFRVWDWSWSEAAPRLIVDYKEGGHRLGDKFSIIGNRETGGTIYAGVHQTNKLLSWNISSEGIIDSEPTEIVLDGIANAGTSITVAPAHSNDDWIYVSGRGFLPTLFNKTDGSNLSQIAILGTEFSGSPLAGRTIEFGGRVYLALFSDIQAAYIIDITKHGENVTSADIIGYTQPFGAKYGNAYGEGAVDMGVIDNELYVFVCGPSNGIGAFRIDGINHVNVEKKFSESFDVSAYPNPAKDHTSIRFTLPQDANGAVAVKLFNMSGQLVGFSPTIAQGGTQEMDLDLSMIEAGQYIFQVVHGNEISTGKLLIK